MWSSSTVTEVTSKEINDLKEKKKYS